MRRHASSGPGVGALAGVLLLCPDLAGFLTPTVLLLLGAGRTGG
ncbi:hypothetical protein [Pseudonocardia lacus]|nr:hypothetical protein [Pseudonocardia lacus]